MNAACWTPGPAYKHSRAFVFRLVYRAKVCNKNHNFYHLRAFWWVTIICSLVGHGCLPGCFMNLSSRSLLRNIGHCACANSPVTRNFAHHMISYGTLNSRTVLLCLSCCGPFSFGGSCARGILIRFFFVTSIAWGENKCVFHRSLIWEISSKWYLRKIQKLSHRPFKG